MTEDIPLHPTTIRFIITKLLPDVGVTVGALIVVLVVVPVVPPVVIPFTFAAAPNPPVNSAHTIALVEDEPPLIGVVIVSDAPLTCSVNPGMALTAEENCGSATVYNALLRVTELAPNPWDIVERPSA